MVRSQEKAINENHKKSPEQKLWRAVLNQAVEDAFGFYTTYMSDYEKYEAQNFVQRRTKVFDLICERAEVDANIAWKAIQRFKLLKSGIIKAQSKKDTILMNIVHEINLKRKSRRESHYKLRRKLCQEK